MTLGLAAGRTSSIGLGPAVLVPSLRHPMVNAAAIAHSRRARPGAGGGRHRRRVHRALHPRSAPHALGGRRRVRHGAAGSAAGRGNHVAGRGHPHAPPFRVRAPRPYRRRPDPPRRRRAQGHAVARELGDGVVAAGDPAGRGCGPPSLAGPAGVRHGAGYGKAPSSPRVVAAAGHGLAVGYHAVYERAGAVGPSTRCRAGARSGEAIEAVPEPSRHLAIHEDHLVAITDVYRPAVMEGIDLLPRRTLAGPDLPGPGRGSGGSRDHRGHLPAGRAGHPR